MALIPKSIQDVIDELAKLPGIGPKTAQRLTFYLIRSSNENVETLGSAINNLKKDLKFCRECCNISDVDPCRICSDNSRNKKMLCVLGEPLDVIAFEKTGYQGVYHVLGGVISPVEGIGPDDLFVKELLNRLKNSQYEEVILATNPNLEGETTALYLQKQIMPYGVRITRIARGLPVGGDLEYADEVTLKRAFEGRREY